MDRGTGEDNDDVYLDDSPTICQLDGCDDLLDFLEEDAPLDAPEPGEQAAQLDGVASVGDDPTILEPVQDENKQMSTLINVINTNVRSLCPKIDSLIDCFDEMDATIGIITETWLADGDTLERDIHDLAKGAVLGMVCLNRRPGNRVRSLYQRKST